MSGVSSIVPKLFIASATLSAICCLSRPDYALPLFVFGYMLWNLDKNHKTRIAYLLIVNILLDTAYVVFWALNPAVKQMAEHDQVESLVESLTSILSVGNLILKIVVLILMIAQNPDVRKGVTSGIFRNLKDMLTLSP